MKRLRFLLLGMTLALCTLFIAGCGNDNNSGSNGTSTRNEQTSGTGNNGTSGADNNGSNGDNNNNSDKNSSSDKDNKGILHDIGDEVKTLADDAESMFNDMVH